MKPLYKLLLLLLFLSAAIASYIAGSVRGFGLFIILGFLFEMGFWIGVFKIKTNKPSKNNINENDSI